MPLVSTFNLPGNTEATYVAFDTAERFFFVSYRTATASSASAQASGSKSTNTSTSSKHSVVRVDLFRKNADDAVLGMHAVGGGAQGDSEAISTETQHVYHSE